MKTKLIKASSSLRLDLNSSEMIGAKVGHLLVVLFDIHEKLGRVRFCSTDVQRRVHRCTRWRPLRASAVLLQAAPQLVVESQQFGILPLKRLFQEGRGCGTFRRYNGGGSGFLCPDDLMQTGALPSAAL